MARNIHHTGPGPSQRQLRVGELIRRTLAEALQRGMLHDPELERMSITVGEVRCSPDLRVATAFVMPLGGQSVDEAIRLLAGHQSDLRRIIGKKCDLKYAPELRFRPDETFEALDRTRRMFEDERVRRDLED